MALTDRIEQLEGEIRGRFEEALRELRDSVRQRLREGEEEALRRLDELTEKLPHGVLERRDVESIAAGAGVEGRRAAWDDLLQGLAAIDGSAGQADALNALLAEARRYASRSVLFLTRTASAEAWGASGWDGIEVAGTRVDWQESEGWRRLAGGRGTVRLSGADCAVLCSRLESPLPAEGVLVPLVLRDRVAAALYADRLEGDDPLGVEALQLLTWAAAQTIEGQPFRGRTLTPTLHPAETGEASLPLWDAPADEAAGLEGVAEAPAPPEVVAEPETAAEPEPAVDQAMEELELAEPLEELELEPEELPSFEEPAAEEPEAAAEPAAAAEPEVELPPTEEPLFEEPPIEEPPIEEPPIEEPPEVTAEEPEPPAAGISATQEVGSYVSQFEPPPPPEPGWQEAEAGSEEAGAEGAGFELEEPREAGFEIEEPEPEAPAQLEEEPSEEPFAADADAAAGAGIEEPSPAEAWGQVPVSEPEIEEPEGEEPPAGAAPEAMEPAPPEAPAALDPGATQFIDRSSLGVPGQVPPPPPPRGEAVHEPGEVTTVGRPRGGAQVTPPEDVIGPGWAFARGPGSSGDDAVHEEARRLARLLVSEIRLYNEEQVEEGRRNGDIYGRLKDDIDRSRQMYEERVDPAALGGTDYFQEELVRILADGDTEALGMDR